ncbi:MAG: MEDS domain-containing protein [archaeon]|nr:MEDS domain-containing protein [archaeon]MCP8314642.1 MEDS domain-containing protein [archaeon]
MSEPKEHRVETEKELTDFVNLIKPRDHIILFYTGIEDKHKVLFTFIKVGLDRGEAAVYVASEENPRQIRKAMNKFGMDVKYHEESGALKILDYKDVYIINGRSNASRTYALWEKLYNEVMERGFKGLRIVGEMSCFFEAGLYKELLDYERSLHRRFEIPMIAICAYNTEIIDRMGVTELLLNLIEAHSRASFTRRSLDQLKIDKIRLAERLLDSPDNKEKDY